MTGWRWGWTETHHRLAKGNTTVRPGREKPLKEDSQGWEGKCAGEALDQDGVRSWLNPCSQGGQVPASRAVEPGAQPTRHGEGVPACSWHISDRFCSSKSSSGLSQCNGCQLPGASLAEAPVPQGARVSGGRLRDRVVCGQGWGLGTWGSQQLLPGRGEG